MGEKAKRQRFVVIVAKNELDQRCFGIYRSFRLADKEARAIPAHIGEAYVLLVEPPEELP